MKSLARLMMLVGLCGSAVLPLQAAFSSLYVFGDGVCTTTANIAPSIAYLYYGNRFCNGRVWVEVLAQRQGLPFDSSKNLSYFGQYSPNLVANVNQFSAPTNANTSLFVVWVNDADFVWGMEHINPLTDTNQWNNLINSSLNDHLTALQALYSKGARTLIMPNAVDITKVPYYAGVANTPEDQRVVRLMVIDFNNRFATQLNQATASLPGVKIYIPDLFALLDKMAAMETNPNAYGFINTTSDAIEDGYPDWTGPGASYLFWDYQNPTAKAHEVMADTVQQMISPPVKISKVTWLGNGNRLEVTNTPFGLTGYVEGRTNLVSGSWTTVTNFNITNVTQTIFVPASGLRQFYRLHFPFSWSWP